MLKNYLLIAQRYLLRYKSYTTINVLGLAVGIACCVLIMLFVRSEFSYDRWNSKADRTYRLWQRVKIQDQEFSTAIMPLPAGPQVAADLPAVEASCRVFGYNSVVKSNNTTFNENITMVDTSLFQLFDLSLERGNRERPFPNPHTLLLTPELAKKYFGDRDPLGQQMEVSVGDSLRLFTVAGIVRPAPEESSIRYGLLIPYTNVPSMFSPRMLTSWFNVFTETYVLLKEGHPVADVEKEFPAFLQQQMGKDYTKDGVVLHLQPLTAIHLDPSIPGGNQPASDPKYSYILGTIGALILLVACINFITLSVGRSTTRAIEVGVRKALGAERRQLIAQFWGEALLLTGLAMALGFAIALALLEPFNALIDRHLHWQLDGWSIGFCLLLTIVIAAVAGSYPAFVLSAFRPVEVLKGSIGKTNNAGFFRKALIVGQFAASIVLLIGTLAIGKQMSFLRSRDLGFNKEQVVIIPTNLNRKAGYELARLYLRELSNHPQVASASVSTFSFAETPWVDLGFTDNKKQYHTIQYNEVDDAFVRAMQIHILQGRDLSGKNSADTNNSILVNETLVKEYGLKDPVGQRFGVFSQRIVGVMKDFNYESLHTKVRPLVLSLRYDTIARQTSDQSFANAPQPRISVRLRAGHLADNIELLKKAWAAVAPRKEFEYHFLDDKIAAAYQADQKSASVVRIASGLSIFIACMGLFGLATLTVSRRTKELGVRKVLGAGTFRLVRLLSYEFIGLVGIAAVIAVPIAAWALHAWLADFAYQTDLSWWIFAVAGLAAVAIALATISFQTIRAANANPADSLRTE
jgi:putative ABC transport system permease protein